MDRFAQALFGDFSAVPATAIKSTTLFVTAALLFRFTERRTLAQFAPFDWIAAVAAGAIVGRSATASDTSWLSATTALVCLLVTHALISRLRFVPRLRRFIDPAPAVLIREGEVMRRNLRRCGLTLSDLQAILRQHGHLSPERVRLAVLEAKGAVSVVAAGEVVHPCRSDASTM
ncbi:DUF421 domain-containing protein [Mycolicibacterium mageritense]